MYFIITNLDIVLSSNILFLVVKLSLEKLMQKNPSLSMGAAILTKLKYVGSDQYYNPFSLKSEPRVFCLTVQAGLRAAYTNVGEGNLPFGSQS